MVGQIETSATLAGKDCSERVGTGLLGVICGLHGIEFLDDANLYIVKILALINLDFE